MSQQGMSGHKDLSECHLEAITDTVLGHSSPGGIPPPAAAPPSRSEIERKLSFKSAARPVPAPNNESPKKNKVSYLNLAS